MKKLKSFLIIAVTATFLSSCAAVRAPVVGTLYTNVKAPITATGNSGTPTKVGTVHATSILGLFAFGDASINKAAKSAGISEIHYIDYESFSILGVYAEYTVYVYGE